MSAKVFSRTVSVEQTVYVVEPNGRRYHRYRGCAGFWRREVEMRLGEARHLPGFMPCGRCWR